MFFSLALLFQWHIKSSKKKQEHAFFLSSILTLLVFKVQYVSACVTLGSIFFHNCQKCSLILKEDLVHRMKSKKKKNHIKYIETCLPQSYCQKLFRLPRFPLQTIPHILKRLRLTLRNYTYMSSAGYLVLLRPGFQANNCDQPFGKSGLQKALLLF